MPIVQRPFTPASSVAAGIVRPGGIVGSRKTSLTTNTVGNGEGLRVRLKRLPGLTGEGVLAHAMYLPCLLNEFTVNEDFAHTDYDTPAGEFSVPGIGGQNARRLRTTDIDVLTLDWEAPWLVGELDAARVKSELVDLGRSRTPCELLAILRLGYQQEELRMRITLRNLNRSLRAGEADTRYWQIGIKEWRDNRFKRRQVGKTPKQRQAKIDGNDTLYSLAKKYYGSGADWRDIAQANGITSWPPSKPLVGMKRYGPGDKLKIPAEKAFQSTGMVTIGKELLP